MAIPGELSFPIYVMFWTILAMMLVLLIALKMVMKTQRHIENIDMNIEKLAKKTYEDEEKILKSIEKKPKKKNS